MRTCFAMFPLVTHCLFAADSWPEFRGPTGQGLSTATNVPTHWSATSNVIWRAGIPGQGWSSPVLQGGRIYLTLGATDANVVSLRAVCIDARDGTILWNVEALRPESERAAELHKDNSLASATPILSEGRLYAHFGQMGTAAVDLGGKLLWRQTNVVYSSLHGNGGSPVLVDRTLVFNCDGVKDPFIVALDAVSGKIRWKTPRKTNLQYPWSFSTPLMIELDGARQIVSPGSGLAAAYDVETGHEIWRVTYGAGHSVIPRPVFANGLVLFSSGWFTTVLHAVDPRGARGDVTDTHVVWKHSRGGPKIPSPIVIGEEVYFVSEAGVATCLDLRTGAEHWNERLGGNFAASPVCAANRIYFLNDEGVAYVLKAGKEFQLLAKNDLKERIRASPAVVDGDLYIRSESHLWRIGE